MDQGIYGPRNIRMKPTMDPKFRPNVSFPRELVVSVVTGNWGKAEKPKDDVAEKFGILWGGEKSCSGCFP